MEVIPPSIYRQKKRREAQNAKICVRCYSRPSTINSTSCKPCLRIIKEWMRKNYARNRAKGLCSCGRPPRKGLKTCQLCYDRLLKYRTERMELGYCSRCVCRRPVKGKKLCFKCIKYAKEK